MLFALALALVAIVSGAFVTYFYDQRAPMAARLCAGACTGFTALGLTGFVIASFLGLTPFAITLAAAVTASPLALLVKPEWRALALSDIEETWRGVRRAISHPDRRTVILVIFYALVAWLLWRVFNRAMFERGGGIYTGVDNDLGDLPFHISIITSFARGANFPPEHTEFSGARLTYPFLVDFVVAMFVRAGATLSGALFWENFVLALSFVGLLHRWALKLTRDWLAALFSPVLVLLSGGLGWWIAFRDSEASGNGFFAFLQKLPHDYTITTNGRFRWGNAITTLLVPQRGLLLGLPLALIIWTLWWQTVGDEEDRGPDEKSAATGESKAKQRGEEKRGGSAERRRGGKKSRGNRAQRHGTVSPAVVLSPRPSLAAPVTSLQRMIAAGAVAGLLPLAHAHSFVVMMAMGGCLALLFPQKWREWAAFFAVALVVAAPQMWWATRDTAAHANSFFGITPGWDHGQQNVLWFWLMNTGLFIPLLVVAVSWHGRTPLVPPHLLLFYLPFTLCFIIANITKLSPWVWDNIKVIFYWYIASVPLVALLLARLWRAGLALRVVSVALLLALTLAGSLDVWRVVSEASEQREWDSQGIAFAQLIERETPPHSLILHAPVYNDPVYLTGRRSPLGYAGHLWSQGIDYTSRDQDVRSIYAGAPDAAALLARYGIEYIVVGPLERSAVTVNEAFFKRFTKVGEVGEYRLYKVAPR